MIKLPLTYILILTALKSFSQGEAANKNQPTMEIKIDGNLTEWGNKIPEYNRSTQVNYQIFDDSKNLYLVLLASTKAITQKIMAGGITFSINLESEKSKQNNLTITYPMVGFQENRVVNQNAKSSYKFSEEVSPEQNIKVLDSIKMNLNRKRIGTFKVIGVSGFHSIPDSVISIYNSYGIKTGALINENELYSYELSIPLKLLEGSNQISYNVRLNGEQVNSRKTVANVEAGGLPDNGGAPIIVGRGTGIIAPGQMTGKMAEIMDRITPTDFWGIYQLKNTP